MRPGGALGPDARRTRHPLRLPCPGRLRDKTLVAWVSPANLTSARQRFNHRRCPIALRRHRVRRTVPRTLDGGQRLLPSHPSRAGAVGAETLIEGLVRSDPYRASKSLYEMGGPYASTRWFPPQELARRVSCHRQTPPGATGRRSLHPPSRDARIYDVALPRRSPTEFPDNPGTRGPFSTPTVFAHHPTGLSPHVPAATAFINKEGRRLLPIPGRPGQCHAVAVDDE